MNAMSTVKHGARLRACFAALLLTLVAACSTCADVLISCHVITSILMLAGLINIVRIGRKRKVTLTPLLYSVALPAVLMLIVGAAVAYGAHIAKLDADALASACISFGRDHGRYPERLDELVPEYVPRVPQVGLSHYEFTFVRDRDVRHILWMVYPPEHSEYITLPRLDGNAVPSPGEQRR